MIHYSKAGESPDLFSLPIVMAQKTKTVKVADLKVTLMNMYKEEQKADKWIQYQRDMEKVYRLALGQIDNEMKAKLKKKGLSQWKEIDDEKCIIKLMKALVVCTQQRNSDAVSYVKLVKENHDLVTKSLGATLVCKATVTYELENNPLYAAHGYTAYQAMDETKKAPINLAVVEQRALAAIIIKGSNTEISTLKRALVDNYALQQNNNPTTSVKTLDMVVAFKHSNWNNINNGTSKHNSNGKSSNRNTQQTKDSNTFI
eukprot:jgi/Psemu1/1289/gm1.1289_g